MGKRRSGLIKWWTVAALSLALHLLALVALAAGWPGTLASPRPVSLELIELAPSTAVSAQVQPTTRPRKDLAPAPAPAPAPARPEPRRLRRPARQTAHRAPIPARNANPPAPPAVAADDLSREEPAAPQASPEATATNSAAVPNAADEPAAGGQPPPPPPAPTAQGPSYPPRPLQAPHPPYPAAARRRLVEGVVVIRAWVDAAGRVAETDLHRSSGNPDLDQSALSTIQRWRFQPGKRQGKAAGYWVKVPIRFQLHSQLF